MPRRPRLERHMLVDEIGLVPRRLVTMNTPVDVASFYTPPAYKRHHHYMLHTPDFYGVLRLPNPAKVHVTPYEGQTSLMSSLLTRRSLDTISTLERAMGSLMRSSNTRAAVKRDPNEGLRDLALDVERTVWTKAANVAHHPDEKPGEVPLNAKTAAPPKSLSNEVANRVTENKTTNYDVSPATIVADPTETPSTINVPNQSPTTLRSTTNPVNASPAITNN